jgi:ribokinase
MIVVFGSINLDTSFFLADLPSAGQTLEARAVDIQPGGKGANQAMAAALDGATVIMAGAVGRDAMAAAALAGLEAAEIDLTRVVRVDLPTGVATILVDAGGANAIVIAPGANLRARAAQIEDALLSPGAILLVQRETDLAEMAGIVARARTLGARVILNLAPAGEIPEAALRALDILVVNEDEAAWLAERLGCAADALSLHESLSVTVIRTLGSNGAEIAYGGALQHVPAPKIVSVDTSAAGDCFCGVLAAALDRGMALESAVRRAVAAASLACCRPGSQKSLPNSREIDETLRSGGG